jgi:hypothetical protein
MNNSTAIIIGATLIAAAVSGSIMVTNHWQLALSNYGTVRVDRWTGAVTLCSANSFDAGAEMDCQSR